MALLAKDCCVLNSGAGAWAFDEFAKQLALALGIDVSEQERQLNYVLHVDRFSSVTDDQSFVSPESIRLATDKRLLTSAFNSNRVPTPESHLCSSFAEVQEVIARNSDRAWCLKYPTSCGAHGHRMITATDSEPPNWPTPFVVQEFVRMDSPEVYRTYCAGGEMFGWVARRYPPGTKTSPWVAHAKGARYVRLNDAPAGAVMTAEKALKATGLWESFGCVDLLCTSNGSWLALEVGTDGLSSHVDREIGDIEFETEIRDRICRAFWKRANA